MKAVLGLVVSCAALLLTAHASDSAGVTGTTTIWNGSFPKQTEEENQTSSVATLSSQTGADNTTIPQPPIWSTGRLSESDFKLIRKIQSWLFLAVEPIAIVLMVLSAVAFLQDRQFASNCYLAAICLFEAWYLLAFFINNSCAQHPECFNSWLAAQITIWTLTYSAMAARRCGYILTGLTSFQRFLAVAFPLKVQRYRLFYQPRLSLALVIVPCFAVHLYRPLQYAPLLIKGDNGDQWRRGFSSLFKEHKQVFLIWADVCRYLLLYLPILICLIFNCLLIYALRRHNKGISKLNQTSMQRDQDLSKNKSERQMTEMILASTFLMLFFNTPASTNEAVSMASDHYGTGKRDHNLYLVLRSGFSLLSQVSKFLIALSYFVLSTAFRRRFLALFRPVRHLVTCQRSAARTASDTSGPATPAVTSVTTTTLTQTSGTKE